MGTVMGTAVLCCSLITVAQAAGYKRIGDVTGEVCAHYIIFSRCHMTDVDAVSEDGVYFFTLKETFDSVTEFNGNASLCHIKLSSGWLSWALGKWFNGTKFYTKDSGGDFTQIYPEYVSFKCEPMANN
jgi:hypothetical protein